MRLETHIFFLFYYEYKPFDLLYIRVKFVSNLKLIDDIMVWSNFINKFFVEIFFYEV